MVPDPTPRLQITFPFIPNRVTASVVEGLVEKLAQAPLCSQAKIKREDNENTWGSQSRKDRGKGCVGKKRETSEGNEMEKSPDTMAVDVWREGGDMRAEWLKKDRQVHAHIPSRENYTFIGHLLTSSILQRRQERNGVSIETLAHDGIARFCCNEGEARCLMATACIFDPGGLAGCACVKPFNPSNLPLNYCPPIIPSMLCTQCSCCCLYSSLATIKLYILL